MTLLFRNNGRWATGVGAVLAGLAVPAHAQSSADVVTEAEDAFGTRIGLERIGLYTESQVRGFSLAQAANYRVDGVYFAPVATPASPILTGVVNRVGWNALSSDFPAPSGIVDYSVGSPPSGEHVYLEAGLLERQSPYLFGRASISSESGDWGFSGGFQAQPHSQRVDGEHSRQLAMGVVAEWRPSSSSSVKVFASGSDFEAPGNWSFVATEPVLPPIPRYPNRYVAEGSRTNISQYSGGAVLKLKRQGWDLLAGIFLSTLELNPTDVTLFAVDRNGQGRALGIFSHRGTANSISGEIKVNRRISGSSRVFAALRARQTTYHTPRASVIDLGPINLDVGLPFMTAPVLGPTVHTRDVVEQLDVAVGFETHVGERLLIRAGVHKAHYQKDVSPPDVPATRNSDNPWLFDAQAVFAVSDSTTLFSTYTKGIEESGSAPATATNRFAALPAVIASQAEFGLRTKIAHNLSFIASVFQVEKPTPSFDQAGAYRLVNEERHRGVELSLTGELTKGLTAVLGTAFIQPRVSGELVDAGLRANRPTGVSSVIGVASLSYAIAGIPGLSVDTQMTYTGDRLVHANGDLEAPHFVKASLGGRYTFKLGEYSATIRALVSNIFDEKAWQASTSQSIQRVSPRAARVTFSLSM